MQGCLKMFVSYQWSIVIADKSNVRNNEFIENTIPAHPSCRPDSLVALRNIYLLLFVRAPEGMNPLPSAPGEKRLSLKPVPPMSNLLAHLLLAPRIPTHLPEETQLVHKDPGPPRILVFLEAPEEVGIPEVTTDTMKKGEESALHLGKGAAVAVIALHITMLGTARGQTNTNNPAEYG